MEENTRLGILGGTFDPPHKGHLHMAKEAMKHFGLSRVLFIPSGNSYMKEGVSDAGLRLKLTRLAVMGRKGFRVSDMEIRRGGDSYSYETILSLKEQYPESELFFIIGQDTLYMMEKWARPEVIFENARIVVSIREKDSGEEPYRKIAGLEKRFGAKISVIPTIPFPCSSSEIREKIKNRENVDALVPRRVIRLIEEKGFYLEG